MAITTVASLSTQEFRNLIAAEMLPRPDDRYIWRDLGLVRNFTDESGIASVAGNDYGRILVDKPAFINTTAQGGFSETNRRLTDGTDIQVANLIGLSMDQFALAVREYAGPYHTAGAASIQPLAITELTLKRSIHDLAALIGNALRRDYEKWINAVFRDLALGTTTVVTADGTAEGAIVVNKPINWDMLVRLRKQMKDLLIPEFGATGRYRYVISTQDESKLPLDADVKAAMKALTTLDAELKNGYIGTLLGFDFYVDTTMPTKGVGAGGAVTGYQGVAFGEIPAIGWINAMAPDARQYKNDDFARKALFVWIAHQGFGTLDVNNVCVRTITT